MYMYMYMYMYDAARHMSHAIVAFGDLSFTSHTALAGSSRVDPHVGSVTPDERTNEEYEIVQLSNCHQYPNKAQ
jgi:hypothetical protein